MESPFYEYQEEIDRLKLKLIMAEEKIERLSGNYDSLARFAVTALCGNMEWCEKCEKDKICTSLISCAVRRADNELLEKLKKAKRERWSD